MGNKPGGIGRGGGGGGGSSSNVNFRNSPYSNDNDGGISDSPISGRGNANDDGYWTCEPPAERKVTKEDFELLKVVGKGSFAKVMLVRRKDTGKTYAMKVLKKDVVVERDQVHHTMEERRVLEAMNHPFIVKLYHAFQTPENLYFVLDYCSGGELFFHLKKEGKFSLERVRLYVAELALALHHLHSFGVIYRDLKPENILMGSDGHIMVTDFGLSKIVVNGERKTGTFCGTPEYLAPEQLRGQKHGPEVDWWALGTFMYEMLSGLPPFYTTNVRVMYDRILNSPLVFKPQHTPAARDLISRWMDRNPARRLGSGKSDDWDAIRSHPFFEGLDWDKLYRKEIPMPFIPSVGRGVEDVANFDKVFTELPATYNSVRNDGALNKIEETKFQGFTFERSDLGEAGNSAMMQ